MNAIWTRKDARLDAMLSGIQEAGHTTP
jgi:hypothetical protein